MVLKISASHFLNIIYRLAILSCDAPQLSSESTHVYIEEDACLLSMNGVYIEYWERDRGYDIIKFIPQVPQKPI